MTAALTGWRLVLLCGLMFVLESDIIFVYISLRFLCHYLGLATMSQLFLDAGLSSLYFSCHTARSARLRTSYLLAKELPLTFKRGGNLNVSNSAYIRHLPYELTPLQRKPRVQSQVGQRGGMKCWITAESAGEVTEPSFTGGCGSCWVVMMFGKFLERYAKKGGQFSSEQPKQKHKVLFFYAD